MSAGFGIGLTRALCPTAPLDQRLELLQRLVGELQLPLLRDFVHPANEPGYRESSERADYGAVEVRPDGWHWLEAEQLQALQEAVGRHWSDAGSFDECMQICDEETGLVIPGVPAELLNSNGKVLWQGPQTSLVVKAMGLALEQLKTRQDEIGDSRVLTQARGLFEVALQHHLPFYLAWG
ncbi:MAG: hypothetical protein KC910_30300 [Candidatus Eremiobacteraeota bacterium]|nr:hypothetical protein [Candidatus Eremiobacteraeota bacterium]